jgi:energy-coupling factor transport system permease protein
MNRPRQAPDPNRPDINPLAQVAGMLILTLPALLSFDRFTPLAALALAVPAIAICLRPRLSAWLPLLWPLLLLAAGAGLTNLLFAVPPGPSKTVWSWGIFNVSDWSLVRAESITARTLALTVIATLSAVAMSPLALVRALMQNLRLSPRWGYSLYAGLNLLPGLRDDLSQLKHTRLIRLAGRRQSLGDALSLPVYLLAGAIRRAERIAVSMTVRELEDAKERTFLVPSPWRRRDNLYLALCASLAGLALAASLLSGNYRFDLG